METGIVLKGIGGYYYVRVGDTVYECRLRGKFRKLQQTALVGDEVKITSLNREQGVIEEILPRRNALIRPPIANVDQALLVFAAANPDPNRLLIDRLLVQVSAEGIHPLLVINKGDLDPEGAQRLTALYRAAGFTTLITSAVTGQGLPELKQHLATRVSVICGPSGAGKSSLINALAPGLSLKTGEVSDKIGRGRHTTRHVELLTVGEGWLADTPGFSSLSLHNVNSKELAHFYPDFLPYMQCRFPGCMHRAEPDCGVRLAVEQGLIDQTRYHNYLELLEEVLEQERRY
ncbi:MAG: ribosome small subunit-dependent GTPase A [Bacillota bacterium]|uniref:Small ribosomal subunit biogenesis GTPase RsgA n=2 Tax=Carboxydocella TaxID=178898 RepID=A0A1T4MU82_9FIRM|nr:MULTISPECIES: ribosome small subunit-dependent GTPase A [Carboxydocella]AVX20325.1 ribosome biogenesis GTPase [Carboxydocella thermautotrophica]AVX30749.1 ribosome biogenesis GTPase [Carboxydocella thermautotrophica]GAW31154.1 GTPase RsgA [Carboxydocella sp. JDF658]SJZ70533.1 ribosome biogenesis GTPase [Carboxydocella sporoproducens DSM 16521]